MNSSLTSLLDAQILGALIALKPLSYAIRIAVAVVAFGAAMNADKVVTRVIGLVWLLIAGGGLLLVGIRHGTVIDILLGLAALGGAAYSWWHTRC